MNKESRVRIEKLEADVSWLKEVFLKLKKQIALVPAKKPVETTGEKK